MVNTEQSTKLFNDSLAQIEILEQRIVQAADDKYISVHRSHMTRTGLILDIIVLAYLICSGVMIYRIFTASSPIFSMVVAWGLMTIVAVLLGGLICWMMQSEIKTLGENLRHYHDSLNTLEERKIKLYDAWLAQQKSNL